MMQLLHNINLNKSEILNSCGLTIFKVSDWDLLKRFIMLGCENGTYYINNAELTYQYIESLENIIKDVDNHPKLIQLISDYIPKSYKKDYIVYILARCCAAKDYPTLRSSAYSLLSTLCTTPTHLFMFIEMYELIHKKEHNSTGWNKAQKQAITKWYLDKTPSKLVYLITKYKNRNGWTHSDVLRLSHIKSPDTVYDQLFKYITKGFNCWNVFRYSLI